MKKSALNDINFYATLFAQETCKRIFDKTYFVDCVTPFWRERNIMLGFQPTLIDSISESDCLRAGYSLSSS